MKELLSVKNFRAGLFVLGGLIILVIMILRVSQGGVFFAKTYSVYMEVESAVGLTKNTPVQIAGVDIGVVEHIGLTKDGRARLKLSIKEDIPLGKNAKGLVKTTGILGDAYVEIHQPYPIQGRLENGDVITDVRIFGDLSSVANQVAAIADDVKAITAQMRKLMAGDGSSFDRTVKNIEQITDSLKRITSANEKNIDAIIQNMRALAKNLNSVVARNMRPVNRTIYNLEDITGTVSRGEGTVGRLIKDDETVEKLNDALDGINRFLGGSSRLQVDLGMHTEYLGGISNFKNYVHLALKPRPDKYFLFSVTSDPDPSFNTVEEITTVASGGTSSTVTTRKLSKNLNEFRFSAQLAKKFYDFTIRGGLIESTGGVGLDYARGPFALEFSAFDFKSKDGQRPHLKALGKAYVTKSFYLLGGLDDFINKNQDLDWFVGAGLTFTDDDIKSLLGILVTSVR